MIDLEDCNDFDDQVGNNGHDTDDDDDDTNDDTNDGDDTNDDDDEGGNNDFHDIKTSEMKIEPEQLTPP